MFFACLRKPLFLLYLWRMAFLSMSVLVGRLIFLNLGVWNSIPSWSAKFLLPTMLLFLLLDPLKCDLMPFSCGFQNSLCAVLLRIWLWCLVARMFSSHVYLGSQEPSKILNLCQDWRTFQLLFHWLCFLRLYSLLESHNLSICSFNDVPKLSVKFIFFSFFLIVIFQKTGLQVSNISSVWTSFSLRFHLYFYLLTKLFISKISAGFFFKIYHFTRFLIHIIHCFADSVQCLYVFSCISMSILLIMLLTHQPPFL